MEWSESSPVLPSWLLSRAVAEVALLALEAPSTSLSAERRAADAAEAEAAPDGAYIDWVIMLDEEVERLQAKKVNK